MLKKINKYTYVFTYVLMYIMLVNALTDVN